MKTVTRLTLFAFLIPSFTIQYAKAQTQQETKKYYKGTSVTVKGGITSAFTDIRTFDVKPAKANGISEMKGGLGISVNRMFSSAFGVQGNFMYGKILGLSDYQTKADLDGHHEDGNLWKRLGFTEPIYFETNVLHGSAGLYVNLSSLAMNMKKANQKPNSDRKFGFYTSLGIGLVSFDSKINGIYSSKPSNWDSTQVGKFVHRSNYDSTYGKVGGYLRGGSGKSKTTEIDFPWSLGVKYKLSRSFDIGLENTVHYVVTDKLDGYVSNLNSPRKKNGDKYMLTALALTYKFVGKDASRDYIEWIDPTETMYDEYQMLADKLRKMTTDSDNDGVPDIFDKEPATPAGAKVDGSGVALDVDGDGIPDYKDEDLFTPKGAVVNDAGKAVDTDGDGVPDILDKEPNTKPGNLVNFEGKTIKQDFATKDDLSGAGGFVTPTIFFDVNKTEIKSMYYPQIAELAKYLKQNASLKVKLTGNTDETGSESSNQKLGQKRADVVKDYLVKYYGIDAARIQTVSNGEKSPLYQKKYSINRRVEIDIIK